jgi:2'-5' RNA ligase
MTLYEAFIEDPAHIAELDGQRFVVLRAPVGLSTSFREIQDRVRERLQGLPVSYPARAHVTLCGFAAGTPLVDVEKLVRSWAVAVPPLRIELAGLGWFPPPFQIVICEVRKTPALVVALTGLRALAEGASLRVSTVVPLEQWRFHMSVAYCSRLPEAEWLDIVAFVQTSEARHAQDEVKAAEIVAFDNGHEYSGGSIGLGTAEFPNPELKTSPSNSTLEPTARD